MCSQMERFSTIMYSSPKRTFHSFKRLLSQQWLIFVLLKNRSLLSGKCLLLSPSPPIPLFPLAKRKPKWKKGMGQRRRETTPSPSLLFSWPRAWFSYFLVSSWPRNVRKGMGDGHDFTFSSFSFPPLVAHKE